MERDLDRETPDQGQQRPGERPHSLPLGTAREVLSREHALLTVRGSRYRVSPAELETMYDIGRFRAIAIDDLSAYRYPNQAKAMHQDLRSLAAQGLLQTRAVWTGPRRDAFKVVALTRLGKELAEAHDPTQAVRDGRQDRTLTVREKQALYSGLVKPNEVRHDTAVFRMFQAERLRLEQAGGRVRRVILDYELKRRVYTPLAKCRALAASDYARRQQEVARQNGLNVIQGKIPLPDLRLEYETSSGELARVDLELATTHYHGPALQAKAQAGFRFYAADGSAAKLARVLEERDITVAILSL